ncbi:hypothetical protein ACMD2_09791 [Ananas comosus]|uniref:Uncharacterized protein n=1 Tax=Ananas comosus TaxID=4615 RepID=A0A199VF22_ANACO|nr:hypothetical protein ACMD2_09791 [Ananas comosus]
MEDDPREHVDASPVASSRSPDHRGDASFSGAGDEVVGSPPGSVAEDDGLFEPVSLRDLDRPAAAPATPGDSLRSSASDDPNRSSGTATTPTPRPRARRARRWSSTPPRSGDAAADRGIKPSSSSASFDSCRDRRRAYPMASLGRRLGDLHVSENQNGQRITDDP